MKLVTIDEGTNLKLGVVTARGVLDVAAASRALEVDAPHVIQGVFADSTAALASLQALVNRALETGSNDLFREESTLAIGPAVPSPGKIICIGTNYRKHAIESNMPIPQYPILFNKFNNTIAAPGEEIPLPFNSSQVDYEAELVIVIGKTAKRVAKSDALNYVLGYCNVNDLSARDLQFRTNQWLLGKSCDKFSPMGPYLVTADEVGNPNDLTIRTYVNGEMRQNSNTGDMIFACDELVSYVSEHMTLSPGDIILTGTPEGVVLGKPENERVYLQDGDEVTIEIEKLGRLSNVMRQEH